MRAARFLLLLAYDGPRGSGSESRPGAPRLDTGSRCESPTRRPPFQFAVAYQLRERPGQLSEDAPRCSPGREDDRVANDWCQSVRLKLFCLALLTSWLPTTARR